MKRSLCMLGCGAALFLAAPGIGSAEAPAGEAPGAASESKPAVKRDPARMSVADIMACMRANIVDRGSVREIELESVDREGASRKLRMKLFWKPAKGAAAPRTVLRVLEPADVAGTAYLAISKPEGDEVYLYMPALGRVQRVTGDKNQNGSLFGTDFTYADIKQVQALTENAETRRLPDEKASSVPRSYSTPRPTSMRAATPASSPTSIKRLAP